MLQMIEIQHWKDEPDRFALAALGALMVTEMVMCLCYKFVTLYFLHPWHNYFKVSLIGMHIT